ncbi:Zinc finger and SCAN domain-containing protein 29 [Chelonia mydas]|uniref:Zinc finger and SCAN domain-containing protein 29 n=1 Tax=Chelonia mydas TaxID=8469 RepID=M7APM4_CHEMY|nr:Zinc finger and SCAN domain-containing protein 29 [Chelonia mydas]
MNGEQKKEFTLLYLLNGLLKEMAEASTSECRNAGDESVLSELRSKRRNAKTFQKISEAMMDRDYSRDTTQCRVKLKELRQAYQKTKESNGRSGTEPQTCRFYAELRAILGGGASTTPPLSVDSDDGVLSAMPEDFADGEDEEEEEDKLEESTQHTVLPDSQDLFITLTEVPSQPNQDGEGTSATNISSLSPPSQRLSQIRRQKKRTHNEMLSELMQSSGIDRAQQQVWRDTVGQYRKAANESEDRRDIEREVAAGRSEEAGCNAGATEGSNGHAPASVGGSGHPNTPPQWTAQATEGCHSTSFEVAFSFPQHPTRATL